MALSRFVPAEVEAALGGRYIIASEIGVGGQGAVFKATRVSQPDGTAVDEVVALKLHHYPGRTIRIRRETTAMENLAHPNLARLIEYGYCNVAGKDTAFIASEFIEGQSLKDRLKTGRLLESEVVPIGRDILDAIVALWSRRIVHGDIKPSNIMLRDSGSAVLVDLGIARFFEEDSRPRSLKPVSPEYFRHAGTPGYMSPEQARGQRPLTCASDIFALGIVLLESVQGWHPTNYDQGALADGIRASGGRLTVSNSLLRTLDMMLSVYPPKARGKLARLTRDFQMLEQMMKEELAKGAGFS